MALTPIQLQNGCSALGPFSLDRCYMRGHTPIAKKISLFTSARRGAWLLRVLCIRGCLNDVAARVVAIFAPYPSVRRCLILATDADATVPHFKVTLRKNTKPATDP